MSFKIGLVAILSLIVLIFLAQNYEVVTVNILFWEISMSRAVLLFFSLLIGFIAGWILRSFHSYRKRIRESFDIKI